MGKVTRNSTLTIEAANAAKEASKLSEVIFLPTPAHRAAKSKFWARYEDFGQVAEVSLEVVQALVADPGLKRWWSQEGFKDWFLNKDEARERLEYLYMVALDAAEGVLLNPDANDNAKVQMVKVIAQLAGKEPARNERYVDEDIQKMTEAQLKKYIEARAPRLLDSPSDDVEEDEETT